MLSISPTELGYYINMNANVNVSPVKKTQIQNKNVGKSDSMIT